MYLVGVDIGGTNLKVGLIEGRQIIDKVVHATNSFDLVKQIVNAIYELLEKNKLKISDIEGVGIGCPGIVKDGVVLESANLNLTNFPLANILSDEIHLPVIIRNDADMATLAEYKFLDKPCKNMLMLTIGTGIGGGIIVDGKLYEGKGGAGELGHMTFCHKGIKCNCGRMGCLEKYVSCVALVDQTDKAMTNYPHSILNIPEPKVSDIAQAYIQKDPCAQMVVNEYVSMLTDGVLSYCNIFRPDKIVIGGGITYAPIIIEMVANKCREQDFGYHNSPRVEIVPAKLGNDAGILGTLVCFNKI